MPDQTIGQILDALGADLEGLSDGRIITDAIIVAKTQSLEPDDNDGPTVFIMRTSGMSWIEQRGLIEIARDDVRQPVTVADD